MSGKIATFLNKLKIIIASTGIHIECNNYGEFIWCQQSYNEVISSMMYCRGPSCPWARNFSFVSAKQSPDGMPEGEQSGWRGCKSQSPQILCDCPSNSMDSMQEKNGVGKRLGAALALLQGFGASLGAVLGTQECSGVPFAK